MPPEQDSEGRKNDERNEKSSSESRPKSVNSSSASELGKRVNTVGSLGMIPVLLAAGPIIGIFIGQWLDKKFDSSPWLTVLFVILGFVAGVREMIQLLKREKKIEQENKRKDSNDTGSASN
jgi:ATP synthase protein I